MDQVKIGTFIAQCRKEKKLTQAQLAEMLNITDRAVSKWETGKSMPDSSIMLELSEILGITVNELLSGERICTECYEKKADENLIALKKQEENNKANRNMMILVLFSAMLLIGITVSLICDLAISGCLTWSRIVIASILLAWLVIAPGLVLGKRGIVITFLSLSVFIFPYLFSLSRFLEIKAVFSVGAVMAAVSVIFLWIIVAVSALLRKTKKPYILSAIFFLSIPFELLINFLLSKMITEAAFDAWDLLSAFLLLILALLSFVWAKQKENSR